MFLFIEVALPSTIMLLCRGVSAISFSRNGSCTYTAGSDGMVCQVDALTGNLLGKFKASTKAISSMSVSPGVSHLNLFHHDCFKLMQHFSEHCCVYIYTLYDLRVY